MISDKQADVVFELVQKRIGDVANLPDWELLEKQVLKWEEEIAELKEAVKSRNGLESALELADCFTVGVNAYKVLQRQFPFDIGVVMVDKAGENVTRFNKPL